MGCDNDNASADADFGNSTTDEWPATAITAITTITADVPRRQDKWDEVKCGVRWPGFHSTILFEVCRILCTRDDDAMTANPPLIVASTTAVAI
jgi:hypothetical protein